MYATASFLVIHSIWVPYAVLKLSEEEMNNGNPRGRFVWHDLIASDPMAALTFYSKTVGWGTQEWSEESSPYRMWTANKVPIGGVMPLSQWMAGASPYWLTYICSPDTDATCREAESLGGQVLTPGTDIPKVGRFAVIQDPHGAIFAPFTPASATPGHDGPPQLGEFSWHELATTDYSRAFKFYSALFGWDDTGQFDMGPMGIYFMFGRRGMALGGIHHVPNDRPTPRWLPYVRVEDVTIAVERTSAGGGSILQAPTEVPGGDWVAMCQDPQGGAFAVHHLKRR